jgi:hypothetical protein
MAAAANMAAGKVPGFRPLVLLAMIHGMQGFYLPAQLTPQYQGHRAHPQSVRHSSPWTRLLRRARPLHDLHAQLDFRAALGRKTTVVRPACRDCVCLPSGPKILTLTDPHADNRRRGAGSRRVLAPRRR